MASYEQLGLRLQYYVSAMSFLLYIANIGRFNNNQAIIQGACTQSVPNNSNDETSAISISVQSVASSTGVDPRFIFAILMEESNGCVRVLTTNGGVRNPGLMQSHNGVGTCNDGTPQKPCLSSEIT